MSPSELLHLFVTERRLFLGCVVVAVAGAVVFSFTQPPRYMSEVILSVARTAIATTSQSAYDQFYRFQADERLADTLVSYLTSRTGRERVAERAALTPTAFQTYTGATLRAARFGTNLVQVEYTTHDRESAQKIGAALPTIA